MLIFNRFYVRLEGIWFYYDSGYNGYILEIDRPRLRIDRKKANTWLENDDIPF